jgi:hypothetical protein
MKGASQQDEVLVGLREPCNQTGGSDTQVIYH